MEKQTVTDLKAAEYHEGDGWRELWSASRLRPGYEWGPGGCRYQMPIASDAMRLGTAIHKAVLQPSEFESKRDMLVIPSMPFTLKKAWLDWCKANRIDLGTNKPLKQDFMDAIDAHANSLGLEMISDADYAKATEVARSVEEDRLADQLLWGMDTEVSHCDGWAKARPDAHKAGELLDVKTTSNFSGWRYQARRLRYPEALAHYSYVLENLGFERIERWSWLVVGTEAMWTWPDGEPRYPVAVFSATDELMAAARKRHAALIEEIRYCEDNDKWPDSYMIEGVLDL